eukprot:m.120601 g.120601  ORF g.120601 m.120601 type:complete len:59 (+) comp14368_c0_seq2:3034-3210(+)
MGNAAKARNVTTSGIASPIEATVQGRFTDVFTYHRNTFDWNSYFSGSAPIVLYNTIFL